MSNIAKSSEKWTFGKFKLIGFFGGPLLFLAILLSEAPSGITIPGWNVVACAALMIVWWITEAIPVPITSLLPIILFPFLDIFNMKTSAAPYASPAVFLYMGGFMLAITIEKWKLHVRIALSVVRLIGTNANGIIAGFAIASGVLSMWMSNTATVVMMLPICFSVINLLSQNHAENSPEYKNYHNFAVALMLSIAYGASIGGIATLIGTPTNTIFSNYMKETFNYQIHFGQWMVFGSIFMVVMLSTTWFILIKIFPNNLGNLEAAKNIIDIEIKNLGAMTRPEKMIAIVFLTTALLWSFRVAINKFLPIHITDESIAMLAGISLFLIPVNLKKGIFLLDWKSAEKLPWGILLLFGGGLSLAHGVESTGLVNWLGELISAFGKLETLGLIILSSVIAVFLTEFMSNMALVTIYLPLLTSISIAYGINPLILGIPVTISASCAFMFPMSTPPNAIVFASGFLRITEMMKAGFIINVVGLIIVVLMTYFVAPHIFGFDMNEFPTWAVIKK